MGDSSANNNCPDPLALRRFAGGRVSIAEWGVIAAHCEECTGCQDIIAGMDDSDDPLQQALLGAVSADDDAELSSLLQSAVAGKRVALPESIAAYAILSELGRGGMGRVYLARHRKLDRLVALKVISSMPDEERVARFEREMRAVGKLRHSHIVHATDAGEFDGMPYLVMEYIEGHDLQSVLRKSGALPIADVCHIGVQAADGLACAAAEGITHRDVKPSNLMLTNDGVIKILDFGTATMGREASVPGLTSSGQLIGTVDYMAPEQIERGTDVDHRADIYGLGATLYALFAGEPPFGVSDSKNLVARIHELTSQTPPPIRTRRREVPVDVADLIEGMLSRNREERPSLEQVQTVLGKHTSSSQLIHLPNRRAKSVSIVPTESTLGSKTDIETRARVPAIFAAAVAIGLFAALAVWLVKTWQNDEPNSDPKSPAKTAAKNDRKTTDPKPQPSKFPDPRTAPSDCTFLAAEFSPDGTLIAAGWADMKFATRPTDVLIWKVGSRTPPIRLGGFNEGVKCIAFSADGTRLAAGGGVFDQAVPGRIRIWNISNLQSPKLIAELPGHNGGVPDIDFLSNNRIVSTSMGGDGKPAFDRSVRIWNIAERKVEREHNKNGAVYAATAWSPKQKLLALADSEGNVTIWKEGTFPDGNAEPLAAFKLERWGWILDMEFSADGSRLAVGSGRQEGTGQLTIWEWKADRKQIADFVEPVEGVGFLPNDEKIAWATRDGLLWISAPEKLREPKRIDAHLDRGGYSPAIFGFSIHKGKIATAGWDQTLRIWTEKGKRTETFWLFPADP